MQEVAGSVPGKGNKISHAVRPEKEIKRYLLACNRGRESLGTNKATDKNRWSLEENGTFGTKMVWTVESTMLEVERRAWARRQRAERIQQITQEQGFWKRFLGSGSRTQADYSNFHLIFSCDLSRLKVLLWRGRRYQHSKCHKEELYWLQQPMDPSLVLGGWTTSSQP